VSGTEEFLTDVLCLLDCGAYLNLIRPEAVMKLGLPIQRLYKPICVTLALNGMDTAVWLTNYVRISLSSKNNAWSSKTVPLLIADGLCNEILLGLPFLTHNDIVIDAKARTVIDKKSGLIWLMKTRLHLSLNLLN